MNMIVKMQFGSHVYGTNVPTSDLDMKGIYLPCGRDIVLQRVKPTIVQNTKKDPTAKNSAEDIDMEIFSLQQFLKLMVEGQTVAMDMLFVPPAFWSPQSPRGRYLWNQIQTNKDKLLHSGCAAFAGYCRQQASKYGIKGSRVSAMREVVEFLSQLPADDKLQKHWGVIFNAFIRREHSNIVTCNGPNGKELPHLEVCNRKVSIHTTVKYAHSIYKKIFDEYGQRALLAEQNNGVDWKALMHAVRVAAEAKELLSTGNIIFPRPEAELLLKIRKAELPYKQVAEMIEQGLVDLEAASVASTLPKEPNQKWIDDLVSTAYADEVVSERF